MTGRKITAMHRQYGRKDGHLCKDCVNFLRRRYNKLYRKCIAYGDSASEATDWNASYLACGMFGIEFDKLRHTPVIEYLKHQPRAKDEQAEIIKGQVSLFEQGVEK